MLSRRQEASSTRRVRKYTDRVSNSGRSGRCFRVGGDVTHRIVRIMDHCSLAFLDPGAQVAQIVSSQSDAGYDPRYDLDGDGMIGFSDCLILVNDFGQS